MRHWLKPELKVQLKARIIIWFSNDFDQDARSITYKCRILLLNHIFLVCILHFSLNITHSFLCTYLQYIFVFLKVNKFELYKMARAGTRRRKNFVDNCKSGAWLLRRDEDSSSCLSRPGSRGGVVIRAVNQFSRSFTLPRADLVESAY